MSREHSHFFWARQSKYNRFRRKTEYFQENFALRLNENQIGVGIGALQALMRRNTGVRFVPEHIVSASRFIPLEIPEFEGIEYRWHQKEALDVISKAKLGTIEIPTGGGKTLPILATAIGASQNYNVLIIAPTIANKKEFEKNESVLGVELTDYRKTRGDFLGESGIIYITSAQAICNDLESGVNLKVLDSIGTILFDECHHVAKTEGTWYKVATNLQYVNQVIGFSGTPIEGNRNFLDFAQLSVSDAMVYSSTGDIIYSVKANQLKEYIDCPELL